MGAIPNRVVFSSFNFSVVVNISLLASPRFWFFDCGRPPAIAACDDAFFGDDDTTPVGIEFDKASSGRTNSAKYNVASRSVARIQNKYHRKNNRGEKLVR